MNSDSQFVEDFSGVSKVVGGPAVSISTFEVKFDASSTIQTKNLYANGRMQVRVLVLISGKDKDENIVPLPDSVLNTVFPIYYNGGQSLNGDWSVWGVENDYLHELPPSVMSTQLETLSEVQGKNVALEHTHVLEFWISSSVVRSVQVGAKVVLNGNTIRTNNTGEKKHDSSVTLNALLPPVYLVDYFRLNFFEITGAPPGTSIFKIYLGLNTPGRSVRLRRWRERNNSVGYPGSEVFRDVTRSSILGTTFQYVIAHNEVKKYPASLMMGRETFDVTVNDRSGELSILSICNYGRMVGPKKLDSFFFTVVDEYGNDHKLSMRPNLNSKGELRGVFLERG
jgi:hypothetical protein